jgi:hypothetical protein
MRRIAGSLLLAGAVMVAPAVTHSASAATERAFTGFGEATVFNVQYGIPGFILTDKFVDHGGPTSQALFESAGGRRANAQMPYIGYMADYPGFPPLVAAALGLPEPPSLPPYAARASADDSGQPEQVVGDEGAPYFLKATASSTAVRSKARLGAPEGKDGAQPPASLATTEVVSDGDKVSVVATTVAQSFSLGPLSIAAMRSNSATSNTQGDDAPVTTTELLVKGGAVGATSFSFGATGLKVAENGVPVPAGEELSKLNSALAPSGLAVTFAGARTVPGGAAAGTFEILDTHPVPGAAKDAHGIFRVRFGGVVSSVSLGNATAAESSVSAPGEVSPKAASKPLEPFGLLAGWRPTQLER